MALELPTDPRFAAKINIPSDMRSAEWAMLPQWVRERAFYMSAVSRAELLQEFRDIVDSADRGTAGEYELRQNWETFLDKAGYKPLPGQEGTIKDLRSVRRFNVALRTNLSLLAGWRQKESGMRPGALRAFPAWELVRVSARRVQRKWLKRFQKVAELREGRMIALKQDLAWADLGSPSNFADAIGVDYPPFAWGSGMGWKPIGFREAKRLGLLDGWKPAPVQPVKSPNESLEITPQVVDGNLRDALSNELAGLAEWKGDKLLFTDPNGTRPYSAPDLAEVWKRPMPEAFADLSGAGQMQREAFLQWLENPGKFWNEGGDNSKAGATDAWDDLLRSVLRLKPDGREKNALFRPLAWKDENAFNDFIAAIGRGGYSVGPEMPLQAWTDSLTAARSNLSGERFQVLLRLPDGHSSARNLSPLIQAFRSGAPDQIGLPTWAGLKIKSVGNVVATRNGKTVEITLEEAS